jgi:UDP-N-acetylmuramoyl-L-alanyl-D-glutamate--2,6-diaminopimelate ligase
MQLSNTIEKLPEIINIIGDMDIEISSMTYDSRKSTPGSLFVAIRGLKSDGHKFIEKAVSQGATALVYDREDISVPENVSSVLVQDSRKALSFLAANYFNHPEQKLALIGITGTNGKTTSNYFLQHLLSSAGLPTARVGTTGAAFKGVEVDLIHTTPESSDLYELLNAFVEEGANTATLEVSSHALDQRRVDGLDFRIGIFSNLSQDHLDYHNSLEEYLKAKQLLFKNLSSNSIAIINADDASAESIIEGCEAKIIRYGYNSAADYQILSHTVNDDGLEVNINTPNGSLLVQTNTVGDFNVYNLVSALSAALELGCDAKKLLTASRNLPAVPGRLEKMVNRAPFQVFVDYAHTPDAMETVLNTLSEAYPDNKLISVFGCGGDRDQTKRPIMGDIATRISTSAIITDDNPRTESSMDIINAIAVGCAGRSNYKIIQDRSSAVLAALDQASKGDIVAILGKGHEPYQEIMGERKPYSDMNVVDQYMEQHGYSA